MIGELQLTTVLLLAGLLWLLLLFIDGVAVQLSWLRQWSDVAPLYGGAPDILKTGYAAANAGVAIRLGSRRGDSGAGRPLSSRRHL